MGGEKKINVPAEGGLLTNLAFPPFQRERKRGGGKDPRPRRQAAGGGQLSRTLASLSGGRKRNMEMCVEEIWAVGMECPGNEGESSDPNHWICANFKYINRNKGEWGGWGGLIDVKMIIIIIYYYD